MLCRPSRIVPSPATPPRAPLPARELALRFADVVHRYGDHLALDRLDLEVARGETLALLGPNGAGKSTTFSLLLGLLRPSSGTVEVLGTTPKRAVAEGRVGAMLQTGTASGLPPGVRVEAALRLVQRLYRRPAPFDLTVERAGIGPLLGRPTHQLSGGQAQRVRFAIAIAGDPELVFLDEPTAAMDVEGKRVFWRMIRQFGAEGRTIVFATHHLQEADQFADRVAVINRGRVVADGPGATLKAAIAARRVRFVCDHPKLGDLDTLQGVTDVEVHGTGVNLEFAGCRRDRDRSRPPQDPLPGPRGRLGRHGGGVRGPHRRRSAPARLGRGVMSGLFAFTRFEVGRLVRSWKFLVITIGFPVVFYMLFVGDHRSGEIVDGAVAWRTYLLVTMCSFGSLVAALSAGGARLSSERATGWSRQLRVTPLPGWSYLATKVVATMLVVLPELLLVEVVGVAFGGVHLSVADWFGLTALLWVSALPFVVLGIFIGWTVHAETAFPVVFGLMFVLGYFGGLFSPVDSMPRALQVVTYILPSYHGAALGISFLDGRGLGFSHWLVLVAYALTLSSFLLLRHRVEESRWVA